MNVPHHLTAWHMPEHLISSFAEVTVLHTSKVLQHSTRRFEQQWSVGHVFFSSEENVLERDAEKVAQGNKRNKMASGTPYIKH